MSTLNKRKLGALIIITGLLGSLTIAFQNFTVNETGSSVANGEKKPAPNLNDAISAALKSAEADTTAKQLALSVEPSQIEKASLRKQREPRAIIDNTETLTEASNPTWAPSEADEPGTEIEDTIGKEVNDN